MDKNHTNNKETTMENISFMAACKRFFGFKEGQGLTDFGAEIKAVSDKDRLELAPLLSKALGVEVTALA